MVINVFEITKAVAEFSKKWAKLHGFSFGKKAITGHTEFFKKTEYGYNVVGIDCKYHNSCIIYRPLISFTRVEEIMSKFSVENYIMWGDFFQQTIMGNDIKSSDGSYLRIKYSGWDSIQTETDLLKCLGVIEQYMEETTLPFFTKYGDLMEVLKLWYSLDKLEDKNIYFGGPDKYLRALIISKLCNDINYENKVKEFTDLYNTLMKGNVAYEPYYENCKKLADYLSA
jgi:hypothetical protein